MSKQRTHKFVTKIILKKCSSLVKIISDGENNFTQNKNNKLQKISAKNKCFLAENKCKSANMSRLSCQEKKFSILFVFKIDVYNAWNHVLTVKKDT